MHLRRDICGVGAAVFLGMLIGSTDAAAKTSPSNGTIDRQVDDITKESQYDWLREGGEEGAPIQAPPMKHRGNGMGSANSGELPQNADGCSFEPNFQDWKSPTADTSDDGCGNSEPMDCDCAPDLGNCACDPGIGSCGACVPSPSAMVPIGYGLGILALALIIFFVVRALIRKLPEEDIPLEDVEDVPEEEIRMSQIHRWDASSLMARAKDAAERGEYKAAVGFIYLLAISVLSKSGYVELERSTTNWHIVQQTRKNGGPVQPVNGLIRHFEDLFFGSRPATRERYDDCLALVENHVLPLEREDEHGQ